MVVNRSKRRVPLIDDYHLLAYETVDSTNEEAKRLAIGGGAHGAFIWSLRQSEGRGRLKRNWVSHEGNLFVSALLQPGCNIDRLPQLSYVAAIAARESIAPLFEDDSVLTFKWPNDLLLNGKKLAGILLESFETMREEDDSRERWVVIGLGMNIDSCPDPSLLRSPATYLKEAGPELVSAKIVLSRFIHHFIEWYSRWQKQGFPVIREYWMEHCHHKAQPMQLQAADDAPVIEGDFVQLDARGNLVIRLSSGQDHTVSAGEVLLS